MRLLLNPLVLIYGVALISVMGVSSILPVLPQIKQAFNLTNSTLGIVIISFTLPGIFFAPIWGIMADRLGRKAILVPCLLIFAIAGVFSGLSDSLNSFVFWRIIQGCGAAALGVLYNSIIADVYNKESDRLKIMGVSATILSLGAAIYPLIGGILGEFSWKLPFFISVLAIPIAIIALFIPLERQASSGSMKAYAKNTFKILKHKKTYAHFAITFCAFALLYGPLITYFPLFAEINFNASPLLIGSIFAVSAFSTSLAACSLGFISKRISTSHMLIMGAICFIMSMLLFTAVNSLILCAIPILLYGLGQGLIYPNIMTSLSTLAPKEGRGIIMAANGTILRLSQTISPLICGLAYFLVGFNGVYILGAIFAMAILYFIPMSLLPKNNN